MEDVYESILATLDSVPWLLAPSVTPIRPVGHEALSFFPGQRGFVGSKFPVGGVMFVANNFDNLSGWLSYSSDLNRRDDTRTMNILRKIVIPEAGIATNSFWLTNCCLGVMDRNSMRYRFAKRICLLLEFGRVLDECAALMRPRLIVSMGGLAAEFLKTDYRQRKRVDWRSFGGHETRLMAIVHPSAWTWQNAGFPKERFREEGRRIRDALAMSIPNR